MLSLQQIDFIITALRKDTWVAEHYNLDNWADLQTIFEGITEGQRKYLHALLYGKKYEQLRNLLNQFGLIWKPSTAQ